MKINYLIYLFFLVINILLMKKIHKHDSNIMDFAHEIAMKSDMRTKHGCVITDYRKKIISAKCNELLNIPQKKINNITFSKQNKILSRHAEENALRNVDTSQLCGASLYVVRTGYDNKFMNSKPCDKCMSIINTCMKKYGLKVVYYSGE